MAICLSGRVCLRAAAGLKDRPAPPEPEDTPVKKSAAKKKKAKKAKKKKSRRKKKIVFEATLPLSPGKYICQACGKTHELLATDPRDQWLRCSECFVKMVPIR